MLTSHDSTVAPKKSMHPEIIKATLSATSAEMEVRAAAEYLAEAMKRIHGGLWKIDIDHVAGFILVSDRSPAGRSAPKPEAA